MVALIAGVLTSSLSLKAQTIFDLVRSGDLSKVKVMVEKNPQVVSSMDETGYMPLHQAISDKKNEIAMFLIQLGADVNSKTNNGQTALQLASLAGSKDIVELLLARGAGVEAKDAANHTSLTNALRSESFETVKLLVDKGANVNNRGLWNMLPIQVAAEFSSPDMVNYLIDKGAAIPTEPGQESYQLLNAACSKGLTKLFEELLNRGFDLQVNRYTGNLLHSAAAGGSMKIVEILLSRGFKVMAGDGYGWSPLHSAAEKGNLEVVEMLINNGADINDRNVSGQTPYNLADFFGHEKVCDFLRSKGADLSDQKFPLLTGKYLGQPEPIQKPCIFGVDIVTTKYLTHGNITFSPDGQEAFWSGFYPTKDSLRETGQILSMRMENGRWTRPELAPFSKIGFDDDSPFITPNGKKLFFLSRRPIDDGGTISPKENIWFVTKEGDNWSNPTPLDIVNSFKMHWQVSVDKKGNLYFGAQDQEDKKFGEIYCSRFESGKHVKPEKLSDKVNSDLSEGSPFISPDGDYLLFDRVSNEGIPMGLYISYLQTDGSWGEAQPISGPAKIDPQSHCCNVTPDGKYLFYIAGYTNNYGVYWADASFIKNRSIR
jgi:ankyrin repeat protein